MNDFFNGWKFTICIALMLVMLAVFGGPAG
jgi:hypothetical protein